MVYERVQERPDIKNTMDDSSYDSYLPTVYLRRNYGIGAHLVPLQLPTAEQRDDGSVDLRKGTSAQGPGIPSHNS